MAAALPPVPVKFKQVNHHLKTAQEHDKRDPVVAYYCRMYALAKCMQIDKTSPEAKSFLFAIMDMLEKSKATLMDHDAVKSETVGQAHVEDYALKMFAFADTEDRARRHTKNVVKSFYTAGMLFDVLTYFGDLTEDMEKYQKYAKYKSAYIHKCLKAGMEPVPGPVNEEGEDLGFGDLPTVSGASGFTSQAPELHQPPSNAYQPPPATQQPPAVQQPPADTYQHPAASYQSPAATHPPPAASASTGINFEVDWEKATKNSKYAVSSLAYNDRESAIDYLQKALNLLTTGHE